MNIMEQRNDCEISSEYECPLEIQLQNLLYRDLTGSAYSGRSVGLSYRDVVPTLKHPLGAHVVSVVEKTQCIINS